MAAAVRGHDDHQRSSLPEQRHIPELDVTGTILYRTRHVAVGFDYVHGHLMPAYARSLGKRAASILCSFVITWKT
jgi:hypothetical protein